MIKKIKLFDINLEVVAGESSEIYFNNEQIDMTSDEYVKLRKMSVRQYDLLEEIRNLNEKAKKMIFLKQAESMLSLNDIKGLLDKHFLVIDSMHVEHSSAKYDIKGRQTTLTFHDNKGEIFQQLLCAPENLKL